MKKPYRNFKTIAILLFAALLASPLGGHPAAAEGGESASPSGTQVQVRFDKHSGPPLVKKFAMYNAGIVPMNHYDRDLDKIEALDPDHLRMDVSIGKDGAMAADTVTGTPGQLKYDFSPLDKIATELNKRNVLPYFSWGYIPKPLQENNDWKNLNGNLTNWQQTWQDIYKNYAKHFKDNGIRIGYHEVYNEPDLFFSNGGEFLNADDYFNHYNEMYKYGVQGLREGDPDAVVGGYAAAVPEIADFTNGFLNYVAQQKLPLDFFSFHQYWTGVPFDQKLGVVREALNAHPEFDTTEIHVNELNYSSGWQDQNSENNYYKFPTHIFDIVDTIVKDTDVTLVSWAQLMESTFWDDAYGIIHRDGQVKAAYNAFKIYEDLPVDRVESASSNGQIGTMASAGADKAAVLLWNRAETDDTVTVNLDGIPFNKGDLRVYRIDKTHASYFDGAPENLEVAESEVNIKTKSLVWNGTIPARSVVYLTVNNGPNKDFNPTVDHNAVATDIKVNHYYPERGKTNWAEFDRKTWKAYLGMGQETSAHSLVGVTAEKLPGQLNVSFRSDGLPGKKEMSGRMGMRVDYRENGQYSYSVYFHDGKYANDVEETYPWGTKKAPDRAVKVNLDHFKADIAKYAPSGWDGRAILSFEMKDTGQGSMSTVTISSK